MSKVKIADCVFRLKDAYQLKIGTDIINLEKNQESRTRSQFEIELHFSRNESNRSII